MKKQAFLPLVTYPDANADAVAGNAVAVAAHLKADLHVVALSAQIREVSSVLSRRLLKLPHLVTEAGGAQSKPRRTPAGESAGSSGTEKGQADDW